MKPINIIIIFVFTIFLLVVIELISMCLCRGNVVVDSLIFTGFESVDPYTNRTLDSNQYVMDDSLYTFIQDSVDYEILVNDKLIFKDTLYNKLNNDTLDTVVFDGWYSSFRISSWLTPGKHIITIKSKTLDVSYTYPFHCFALKVLYVDSSRESPYFTIHGSFIPLRRKMM